MQLLCDAITVLGSRHGVLFNPIKKCCQVIRFDRFEELPEFGLKVGINLDGNEYILPLCREGTNFDFLDQRMGPCRSSFIGIHANSGIKVRLDAFTPFRPRDADFSTSPVLAFKITAEKLKGTFRWKPKIISPETVSLFFEIQGLGCTIHEGESLDLHFDSIRESGMPQKVPRENERISLAQHDRLIAPGASLRENRFSLSVDLNAGKPEALQIAWCSHCSAVLSVRGKLSPFRYSNRFAGLEEVTAWARKEGLEEIIRNSQHVETIVSANDCSASVNKLLAYTLHSWLANTWWVKFDDKDWFSVWEGNCYFHSTIDVEFTQSPFYLALWPELLGIQLDQWPLFSKSGAESIGERGVDTAFLSHDMGAYATSDGQRYPHEMEVEETSNYLILLCAYWRRTGDDKLLQKYSKTIEKFISFLIACDASGSGVPTLGVANTVDDGSPAIQFGREQIYLAVKTLAAFVCSRAILSRLPNPTLKANVERQEQKIRCRITEKGWQKDHYGVLLEKSGSLTDPWTGKTTFFDEVPGWDAAHIYTTNAFPPLDMIGMDVGLPHHLLKEDLEVATQRCLREYGCTHTDFKNATSDLVTQEGLAGASQNPGWISMNIARDLSAIRRGVNLSVLWDRYWDWQCVVNSQEPRLFFETFNGNNLCFYPRGVVCWGIFEAFSQTMIDRVSGTKNSLPAKKIFRIPDLFHSKWKQD